MDKYKCEHGEFMFLADCPVCYEQWQKEQDKKWWANLQANADSIRHYWEITHPIFTELCGDPVEEDQFR